MYSLQLLMETVTYLHQLDNKFSSGLKYDWSNQVAEAKERLLWKFRKEGPFLIQLLLETFQNPEETFSF